MSGKNFELSLVMRLRDLASSGFARSQRDIQSGIDKTDKATVNLTRTVANLNKQRAASEVLGIRTEQNIQREIQRTEAAYERLKRSGTLSMSEQARAAEAAKNRIRELNNEMGKYTLGQRIASGFNTGRNVAAGALAAGYVMSRPVNQTMDYGMRLAQMSNTAFNDRNTAGRIAGKAELNDAIVKSVRTGGGTRDGAATALDTMIASGTMKAKDAMNMLPSLMKASTASGADAGELAQIGIRSMQSMNIKPADMGKVFDMSIAAGQAGGFELKDLAKWLPQQMAAAQLSGISGKDGLAKLLAANQASAITAGTKDGAGNNLTNLLLKLNSRDTAVDAQKQGINLSGTLAAARGKGIDSLDAFVGIADHVIGKDKSYQALQAKLKTATGADRKAILESQTNILQGSAIGKILQDREAVMALVGSVVDPNNNHQVLQAVIAMIEARVGDYALDTGVADAYVVALNPVISAYTGNFFFSFKALHANAGASTVDFGAGPVALNNDVGGALAAGDITAGMVVSGNYSLADNQARITSMVQSQAHTLMAALISSVVPAGTKIEWTGPTAPAGFLQCPTAPTNISRTTYAALFAAIGTTWGAGDGATTFCMPWFPAGYAAVHGTTGIGGSSVGSNLSHNHIQDAHGHTDLGHVHNMTIWGGSAGATPSNVMGSSTLANSGTGSTQGASAAITQAIATNQPSGGAANLAAGQTVMMCVKY